MAEVGEATNITGSDEDEEANISGSYDNQDTSSTGSDRQNKTAIVASDKNNKTNIFGSRKTFNAEHFANLSSNEDEEKKLEEAGSFFSLAHPSLILGMRKPCESHAEALRKLFPKGIDKFPAKINVNLDHQSGLSKIAPASPEVENGWTPQLVEDLKRTTVLLKNGDIEDYVEKAGLWEKVNKVLAISAIVRVRRWLSSAFSDRCPWLPSAFSDGYSAVVRVRRWLHSKL